MKHLLLALSFVFLSLFSVAQTYSEDIANILNKNCVTCHRDGGIAPFPLTTYQEVYPKRMLIEYDVTNGIMPPWPADTTYVRYAHERVLTLDEITKIQQWVQAGGPQGDSTKTPPVPTYPSGSDLGVADLVLKMPVYTSTATSQDVYRSFVIPSGLLAQQFMKGIDIVPGNRSIVHHVLVYMDTTGTCKNLDNQDPGPGFSTFGGVGTNSAVLLSAWVPGSKAQFLPNGMGTRVAKNADIILQIHYPAGSVGQQDSTSVHFFFNNQANIRQVYLNPILNHTYSLTNGPLVIPANTEKDFTAKYTSYVAATALSVAPHMHLIGESITSYAVPPGGADTIPFIRINKWDFHWQGGYYFRKALKIPLGSVLWAQAHYNNTNTNPHNPSSPPQLVTLGEETTDEMMLVYFQYMLYKPGDENIIIDSTLINPVGISNGGTLPFFKLFPCYPNPTDGLSNIAFYIEKNSMVSLSVYDHLGRQVLSLKQNEMTEPGYYGIPVSDKLSAGMYFIKLESEGRSVTEKLIIE